MAADLLEHGVERPPRRMRPGAVAAVLVALAVGVVAGLSGRGAGPQPRPLVERAHVLSVRETADGALHVHVEVDAAPGSRLESVAVDLPGSGRTLLRAPGSRTGDRTGLVDGDLLPRCPDALAGQAEAAVTAVVRGRGESAGRRVRVGLDTEGPLADAVRARCGTVAGVPELRTSRVELDGPVGDPLRTSVDVAAAASEPVTVVAVRPGLGVETALRSTLPVTLSPGGARARLRVDLRLAGCGGVPDTPPYLLVLSTGEAVGVAAAPEVAAPLAARQPDRCTGRPAVRPA